MGMGGTIEPQLEIDERMKNRVDPFLHEMARTKPTKENPNGVRGSRIYLYMRITRTTHGGSNKKTVSGRVERVGENGDHPSIPHVRKSELAGGVFMGKRLAVLPPTTPQP